MDKYIKTELIENFMKEKGLSKTKFCKMCRIGLRSYEKVMNNNFHFRVNILFKIAKTMGLQAYQLLY